ncbi:UNVERIFIED_CONTAM: hypothetical protein GTU68_006406 [Idotea baltica]|nr:hypothetical protein [Idotea baltica]
MTSHDPTTLNQQGADKGTQYRSVIYYHNDEQRTIVERVINGLKSIFSAPIVTEIVALDTFFPGESYHQNYFNNNKYAGYCRVVIEPKIRKLREQYSDKIIDETAN